MSEWLRALLGFHQHQWEDIGTVDTYQRYPKYEEEARLVTRSLVQRCKDQSCGKTRRMRL